MNVDASNDGAQPTDDDEPESPPSRLRTEYPRLYSVLVRADERVERYGCATVFGLALAAGALGFVVNRGGLDLGLEGEVDVGVSTYLLVLGGWLGVLVNWLVARWRYEQIRERIVHEIQTAALSVDELIAEMAGESRFDSLLARLCRDRRFDRELG